MFDWSKYTGNLTWLQERTVFLTKHGSHAYGTSTPESDLDIKGVVIPPKEYLLGFAQHFEQAEQQSAGDLEKPDLVIYDIRKFFLLASNCNPNIVEILFTDKSDWLDSHWIWYDIYNHRDWFISQRAKHTFSGYAVAQLKRIKLHRRYLLNPVDHKPTRGEFGLPEVSVIQTDQKQAAMAAITKKLASWQVDFDVLDKATREGLLYSMAEWLEEMKLGADEQFTAAGRLLGYESNFLSVLNQERLYKNALNDFHSFEKWKETRNEKRRKLEASFGYDTKHGMHLVRLLRMAREILVDGKVIVKRPDAEELLAIRNHGIWPYEQLVEWADNQDKELSTLMDKSPLPKSPPMEKIDQLCIDIVDDML